MSLAPRNSLFSMHLFLYEWITGGGLVEEAGTLPPTLLAEGSAMLAALAEDFSAIDGCRVSVLKDMRLDQLSLPGCEVIEVHSSAHRRDVLTEEAAAADHTLIIAPEFDNILGETHALAREAGANVLAPAADFVALAADKNLMARSCHDAGIRTPRATVLEADEERLPADFEYPAVLKPVVGAGSQHTLLIASARDEPPPYPWPRRLEQYCVGTPVSVAFLCGADHRVPLAACRQHQSNDGRFTYLGGSLLLEDALARRATALADRVLEAVVGARAYVGVDMILGKSADGSEDFFLEVNPRMTTSYVGLRAATDQNLAAALLANAAGQVVRPRFRMEPLEFLADGSLREQAS
ncbi:MAG: ATP-grasp domain-containing protein [Pirellulales bacterium]|nr:ATP-grasp domain-containing protein [Pirellulales bacterium]